jgi:hypothetical protein
MFIVVCIVLYRCVSVYVYVFIVYVSVCMSVCLYVCVRLCVCGVCGACVCCVGVCVCIGCVCVCVCVCLVFVSELQDFFRKTESRSSDRRSTHGLSGHDLNSVLYARLRPHANPPRAPHAKTSLLYITSMPSGHWLCKNNGSVVMSRPLLCITCMPSGRTLVMCKIGKCSDVLHPVLFICVRTLPGSRSDLG